MGNSATDTHLRFRERRKSSPPAFWEIYSIASMYPHTLKTANARRQPAAGAAWLAEPRSPTRIIWLWLHCVAFFYSTTFLPPRSVRRPGSLAAAERRPSCIAWDWIRERP